MNDTSTTSPVIAKLRELIGDEKDDTEINLTKERIAEIELGARATRGEATMLASALGLRGRQQIYFQEMVTSQPNDFSRALNLLRRERNLDKDDLAAIASEHLECGLRR